MSREIFQSAGWIVELVEHHNPYSFRTHDFLGFADLIVFCPLAPPTIAVQVCGRGDRLKRLRKILGTVDAYEWLRGTNSNRLIWIHSWKKQQGNWLPELTIVSEEDFDREIICRVNSSQDAALEDVKISQLERTIGIAPSIKQSQIGLDLSNETRLGNVIPFITPRNGER